MNRFKYWIWKTLKAVTYDHLSLDVFDTTREMEDGIITKPQHSLLENFQ